MTAGPNVRSAHPPSRSLPTIIAVLAFAVAVIVATEFIVVGVLPMMARDLRVTIDGAGRLVTWFALSSAILGPPLTLAASRVGARLLLVLALITFALGNLTVAVAPSYTILVAVRIVQGAALPPFISVGIAAVAGMAERGREGRAVALVHVGMVVGAVLAMPSAVFVADFAGWPTSFVALAVLALTATVLLYASFPQGRDRPRPSVRAQAALIARPSFQAHLLLSALLFTAMFAAYTYIAAFLESIAGFSGQAVAVALVGFGIAGLLGNWIAGRAVDRDPTRATAGAAVTLMVVMPALSVAGGTPAVLIPLLAIWGATHAASFLICQVRVMLAGANAPELATALNISACNLGIALGAAAGGAVVERHGVQAIGFGSAAVAALALVVAGWIVKRAPHRAPSGH